MMSNGQVDSQVVVVHFETSEESLEIATVTEFLTGIAAAAYEANAKQFPGTSLQIRVKPFEKGSFEIPLIIAAAQQAAPALWDALPRVQAVIGIVKDFFELWKAMHGKVPEKTRQLDAGRMELEAAGGEKFIATSIAGGMYAQHVTINNYFSHITRGFEGARRDAAITGFELRKSSGEAIVAVDRETFKEFADPRARITQVSDTVREQDELAELRIVKPVLEGGASWEFVWGGRRLKAKMQDPSFSEIVAAGEKFAQGDVLEVQLRRVQKYHQRWGTWVDDKYSVIEVVAHHLRGGVDPNPGVLFDK